MTQRVVGRCDQCGGRVLEYTMLHIVGPFPPARCESCGAVRDEGMPVIKMKPVGRRMTAIRTDATSGPTFASRYECDEDRLDDPVGGMEFMKDKQFRGR